MLTESERRAARLAVSRYGADRAGVQRVFQAVMQAQSRGQQADLLEAFVRARLLTASQAQELRAALDSTHLDPGKPAARVEGGTGDRSDSPELSAVGGYRILRKLGEGGMGSVYLAYGEREGRQVAIKVLAEGLAASRAYVERFSREGRNGILLNHPHIVRNLDVGRDKDSGRHYLVMEYVDGASAHALLEQHGRLEVGDAVHIVLDIARALEHAHSRSVVHRDIKPDNILITRSGVAKLADLGLAKRTDEVSHLTATRQGFGTPHYMPYEQAMNAKYADARSDIYALGATLYHLVAGEVPFSGVNSVEIVEKKNVGCFAPASNINPAIPPRLDAILEQMLAREPDERYQTASELIIDLERSGLAVPVPSFVDQDLALQDPVVRQRLVAPAEPTRLDVNGSAPAAVEETEPRPDVWFLRFRNRRGQWCKTRATTEQVVRRLQDGRIPLEVEACHELRGDFQPLAHHPEFQQLLSALMNGRQRRPAPNGQPPPGEPKEETKPHRPWWWLLLGGGLAVSGVAAGAVVLCKVFLCT